MKRYLGAISTTLGIETMETDNKEEIDERILKLNEQGLKVIAMIKDRVTGVREPTVRFRGKEE